MTVGPVSVEQGRFVRFTCMLNQFELKYCLVKVYQNLYWHFWKGKSQDKMLAKYFFLMSLFGEPLCVELVIFSGSLSFEPICKIFTIISVWSVKFWITALQRFQFYCVWFEPNVWPFWRTNYWTPRKKLCLNWNWCISFMSILCLSFRNNPFYFYHVL